MALGKKARGGARKRGTRGLTAADFRGYLVAKAAEVAPTDVTALVARRATLSRRAATDRNERPLFARRVGVAVGLLADHMRGRCPQIPLSTVSLLAAALFYYLDPIDVIPDFIPRVGTVDDALMLELACTLGADGLRRYCEAVGIETGEIVPRKQRRAGRRGA